jgi:hypothetical protein
MKTGFKKAGKSFKYLAVLFTLVYWIFIIIDDWVFIEEYWPGDWHESVAIWLGWYFIYFLGFSCFYWTIAIAVIFIYYKLILGSKTNGGPLR